MAHRTVEAKETGTGKTVRVTYSAPDAPRRSIECPTCGSPAQWRSPIYRCKAGHEAMPAN